MKTHDSKKQFKCTKCNKGYNTVSAFSFHEKTHKNENPGGLEDCEEHESLQVINAIFLLFKLYKCYYSCRYGKTPRTSIVKRVLI